MYGFPAPLEADYKGQLLRAGYPSKDIELALKWSRSWDDGNGPFLGEGPTQTA
jgi:hypothetical protein